MYQLLFSQTGSQKKKKKKEKKKDRKKVLVGCVCVCACVFACMCARVCVLDREGSMVVVSRALVVIQTAMYRTGYGDCLTGFLEPLSTSKKCDTVYRYDTGLKNVYCNHW